jgi:uridine phosphorylase
MPYFSKNISQELGLPGRVKLRLAITIGASGAIASYAGQGLSIVKTSTNPATGQLKLYLDRQWVAFAGFHWGIKVAGAAATLTPVLVDGNGVTTDYLTFETRVAAGTATNMASGDVLYLTLIFNETNLENQVQ